MLASGGLLVAFLISWLMAQYRAADKQVQKDVRADLRKTSDQLVDSMMIQLFTITSTQPLNTSATLSIPEPHKAQGSFTQTSTEIKIVVNNDSAEKKIVNRDFIRKKPIPNVRWKHFRPDSTKRIIVMDSDKRSLNDSVLSQLFTQSAGAMAKQLSTYQKTSNILTLTNQELDTVLCRKLLRKNWQNDALNYRLVFHPKPADSTLLFSGNPLFGTQFGVRLENKGKVVFASILPEFFFALFLLLITGIAFTLVYRSYLRQLQINALRTDFVNNISHELKTPVSTVRVALDALQNYNRKNDPKLRDEYLELMSLEVDRLDKLIHQVLQHGQLNSAENLLKRESLDLNLLVREVAERYRLKAEEKGARLTLQLPDSPTVTEVDAEHLSAVIGNLLENALSYAGKHPEIRISLSQNGKHIQLDIADNGPGIAVQYLPQLFKPFFRVPSGNTHNVKGYGLGLSYCKQIIEQHRGTITASNLPSGGCLFRITLNA